MDHPLTKKSTLPSFKIRVSPRRRWTAADPAGMEKMPVFVNCFDAAAYVEGARRRKAHLLTPGNAEFSMRAAA
jgi:hypothetical protein